MAYHEIATKANPALVLPILIIAQYAERTALLLSVTKTFYDGVALDSGAYIQLTLDDGKVLRDQEIVWFFAELDGSNASLKYTSPIQEWVKKNEEFALTDFQYLRKLLGDLDAYLTLRTHIAGYDLTVADLVIWATLRGNKIIYASIRETPNHVSRWYNYIEYSNPWISEVVAELMARAAREGAALDAVGASYEINLLNIQ